MAHVSIGSKLVLGAVATQNIPEGRFVVLGASGVHRDLPGAAIASTGTTKNVFVAFASVDRLPRPTPVGMFMYDDTTMAADIDPRNATEKFYTHNYENAMFIGPSAMPQPTLLSGWKITAHRGGAYQLYSGGYVDSANIKIVGSQIKVGASGMAEYTSSTDGVGFVREYRDGVLTIVLNDN